MGSGAAALVQILILDTYVSRASRLLPPSPQFPICNIWI